MQCKCSLNNNYQIITLCNLEKFNQKISQFVDNSWTQIIIPENLTLPINFPDIEDISKVYLDINIKTTKIINTPKSENPNVEGLTLTGKKLLVSGCIHQTIVYISNTYCQSMHSIKFNIPFNTFIVIDENTDIDIDKYCVYPCIENVSVKLLTKRNLTKSVALFLFAHKIPSPIPPPPTINITNKFIFRSAFDNSELATVAFDSTNKKLVVTSTGTPYDIIPPSPGQPTQAFIFLLTTDGKTFKATGLVKVDGDATDFKTALNEKDFEIYDLIVLRFLDKSKVSLTDYPLQGESYQMIAKSGIIHGEGQSFKITTTGIVPNILANDITLNDINNNPVVTIQFDILFQKFLCKSNVNITDTNFTMTLYHPNGTSRKNSSTITQYNTGSAFVTTFNDFSFQWNDIIKLDYDDNTKVLISNLSPLTGTSTRFRITENGLVNL